MTEVAGLDTASGRYDAGIMSVDFQLDPFELYGTIREEAPAYWCEPWNAWLITRYDDVVRALRDSDVYSSEDRHIAFMKGLSAEERAEAVARSSVTATMLDMDPPRHTRLRKLSSRAFTPRSVAMLRPLVAADADRCLAAFGPGDTFDFISAVARPLPALAIARMLGLPVDDHETYLRWVDGVIEYWSTTPPTPDTAALIVRVGEETDAYFREWISRVRDAPPDTVLGDLVRTADQGDRLGYEELVTYCGMLLNAASDTTRALIGDATAALLADPALLARVRADTSLIPAVVEESMRHDSPLLRAPRVLVDDVELHGTTLPRGDLAFAIMASANRDPRVFDDPDRFDIDRPNVGANVGFGSGRHLCIGAAIARLEAEVAIERLLANFPDLTLAAVSWRPLHLVRSPEQVAISVGARP